ncbi:MAG TPA: ABC transporter permease [Symbiobacteriaceae bacterium]|nr:ABC transporter permease [Symbiobacteriaceae bacterium]
MEKVEGVSLVSPQKMTSVIIGDGEQAFLQVFDHKLLQQYSETMLEEGTWESAADQMEQGGHTIVSPAIAARLQVGLGDRLTVSSPDGPVELTVVGIMTDITPYGGTINIDRQDCLKHWHDQTSTNVAVLVEPGASPAAVKPHRDGDRRRPTAGADSGPRARPVGVPAGCGGGTSLRVVA